MSHLAAPHPQNYSFSSWQFQSAFSVVGNKHQITTIPNRKVFNWGDTESSIFKPLNKSLLLWMKGSFSKTISEDGTLSLNKFISSCAYLTQIRFLSFTIKIVQTDMWLWLESGITCDFDFLVILFFIFKNSTIIFLCLVNRLNNLCL